jgi:hypothetical protein
MAVDETKVLLSTRFNILKIYDNGSTVVNVASIVPPFDPPVDYLLTTHNLGYVPRARVWYEPVAGQIWPMSDKQYDNSDGGPGTSLTTLGSFYLTTTGLYVRIRFNNTGGNFTFYWRVYLDE